MKQRPSLLIALASIGISAAMWVVVGVSVAAGIASIRMSLWVIGSIPAMAATTAVLGAVQGLLFYVAGHGGFKSEYHGFLWLGALSGPLLGALGFPPVFTRSEIIATRPTVAFFLLAATVSGLASGLVSAHVLTLLLRGQSLKMGWKIVAVALLILGFIDYRSFGPATLERIAVPQLSRQDVSNLSPGNAQGSRWTGCYEFRGKTPLNQGGGSGLLKIVQSEGMLKVEEGRHALTGWVDRGGRFRFGGEVTEGDSTVRILWQGRFLGDSFEFSRRFTVVNGVNQIGINPLTGMGHMVPCVQ